MVLLITQERASPGVIVSAATLPFAQGLLTASDAAVACYRLPPPPTAAAAAAAEPEPQRLWQQPVSGGRVELAVPLAPDCQAYLLVTSHGAAAPAQAAVVQVLGDSGGGTVHQQQWQLGSGQPRHHICAQLDLACNVRQEEPPVRPTFSGLVHCGGGTAFMLAASLHEGTVHVLRVERGPGGIWRLDATPNRLSTLQDTELGKGKGGTLLLLLRKAGGCPAADPQLAALSSCLHTCPQARQWWPSRSRWDLPVAAWAWQLAGCRLPSSTLPIHWAVAAMSSTWLGWSCRLGRRRYTAAAGSSGAPVACLQVEGLHPERCLPVLATSYRPAALRLAEMCIHRRRL